MYIKYFCQNNLSLIQCSFQGYHILRNFIEEPEYQREVVNETVYLVPTKALVFNNQEGIVAKGTLFGGVLVEESCNINNLLVNQKLYVSFSNKICEVPNPDIKDIQDLEDDMGGYKKAVFLGDMYLSDWSYIVTFGADNGIKQANICVT